jgi:hypothetical protein
MSRHSLLLLPEPDLTHPGQTEPEVYGRAILADIIIPAGMTPASAVARVLTTGLS